MFDYFLPYRVKKEKAYVQSRQDITDNH